ncbi:MAG TPA: RNA methyltransferase [Candidatus Limihabitans stercoravium]|nr:RNA methyltransferase [Candidatus Limihabitans stercoravium]
MVITSASNSKVLLVRKLQDKKYRNRFKQYCIEGVRLYQEALRFGKKPLEVFVKQSLSDKLNIDGATVVEDNVFDKMSDTVSSQGLIAVLPIEDNDTVASGNCLVLDSLQDPGNVGTLLRTACATGFDTVYLYRCVDVYSPKCVRSAMSAHFAINLVTVDDFDVLKQRISNCRVVCADMDGKDVSQFQYNEPIALVLGNEGNGIGDYFNEISDDVVSLSMKNNLESLNVAVAGSILMYILGGKQ